MTINHRIRKIIDELFSGNKRAFSFAVGVSPTVTENIVGKRQSNPSFDVTSKIAYSIDNINSEWLLTGNGDMLKIHRPRNNDSSMVSEEQLPYGNLSGITKPFIESGYSIGETTDSFSHIIDSQKCREIAIPFVENYDFSLRQYGDSMTNPDNPLKSINDQDIVVCKLWKNTSYIRWGEIYALVTSQGNIIKKIIPSEEKGYIKCVSLNERAGYLPYDLPENEIFDWAIVVGVACIRIW